MKQLIEEIVKTLVDHPEQVFVQEVAGQQSIVYEIKVDPADIGKVIGKQGKTAQAMRTLLTAVSAKEGKRAILEIED